MSCHGVTQSDQSEELTVILGSVGPENASEGAEVLSGNIFLRLLLLGSNLEDSKSPRRFSGFSPEFAASTRSAPGISS